MDVYSLIHEAGFNKQEGWRKDTQSLIIISGICDILEALAFPEQIKKSHKYSNNSDKADLR